MENALAGVSIALAPFAAHAGGEQKVERKRNGAIVYTGPLLDSLRAPMAVPQERLGHVDARTTMGYTHLVTAG